MEDGSLSSLLYQSLFLSPSTCSKVAVILASPLMNAANLRTCMPGDIPRPGTLSDLPPSPLPRASPLPADVRPLPRPRPGIAARFSAVSEDGQSSERPWNTTSAVYSVSLTLNLVALFFDFVYDLVRDAQVFYRVATNICLGHPPEPVPIL